ncbi:hypothetical protein EV401DRAFT_1898322 [Pisolithus croceorrhizus]|nr:hypothetical protein EV401DRAFT_1898322 [Pisolithus croceorrhizus]
MVCKQTLTSARRCHQRTHLKVSVVRDRSVIVRSKNGHALWLSKKALELSAPLLRDIEGGVTFHREDGQSTGSPIKRGNTAGLH